MNLKRLLIALISLSFILAVNTSCKNDRDAEEIETTLDVSDLSNTYKENKLIINTKEANKESSVVVTAVDAENVTFKLINLVTDRPEITFTTKVTKKEGGAFSFDQTKHYITENDGFSYFMKGSFVGNAEVGTTIVAEYSEMVHMTEEDIFTYKGSAKIEGNYNQENFVVNGEPAIVGYSANVMKAKFTKNKETKKVVFSGLFFNNDITINNLKLVRSLEEPNTFTFLHFSEEEPSIVDDNDFRTITITKGVIVKDIVYVEASVVSKSEFVDTKWQIDRSNKNIFNITIKSREPAEQKNDAARIEFLKKHYEVVTSLLLRLNTVKFNRDLTADISYLTNTDGVIDLNTPAGAAFNFTSLTSLGLGINEIAMQEVAEQSRNGITPDDVSSMFGAGSNKYRYFPITWKNTTFSDTKSWKLILPSLRNAAGFAAKSMPKTEEGMRQMGFTMSIADIKELEKIFIYMDGRTNDVIPKYNINNGEIIVAVKKVN